MTDNFVRASTVNKLVNWYFYVDRTPYEADGIFIGHKLGVNFGDEFTNDALVPYTIVTCWVWRWKAADFEACMRELTDRLRSPGYERACEELQRIAGE